MKYNSIRSERRTTITVLIGLIFFLSFNLSGAKAQDSLAIYLKTAALKNPGLQAKYKQYLASLEMVPQVGSLPDPEITLGVFLKPNELNMGNQIADIRMMQMFPWKGTLTAAKSEASLMAKAKYQEFITERNQLYFQVKNTWYELFRLQKEIRLAEENLRLLQSLESMTRIRYRSSGETVSSSANNEESGSFNNGSSGSSGMSGNGMKNTSPSFSSSTKSMQSTPMSSGNGMVDILRLKMERGELENKLALLKNQKRPLIAIFNGYLNQNLTQPINIPDTLIIPMKESDNRSADDSIRNNNPMLKMYDAEIASNQAAMRKAQKMKYPMIGLGLDYMLLQKKPEVTDMKTGQDMVMPMITVTLPIYRKKYTAMKHEAELKMEAVQLQKSDMENQLLSELRQVEATRNDAFRRTILNKNQTQYATQSVQILKTEYLSAGKNMDETLRMMRQLLDYRFNQTDAAVDFYMAQAKIDLLTAKIEE